MVAKTQTCDAIGATVGGAPKLSMGAHAMLREEGEYWTVAYAGRVFRIRDTKGLAYLARLIQHPGTEFHALDLARGEATLTNSDGHLPAARLPDRELDVAGIHVASLGDAGSMLDQQAKVAYRRWLAELRAELEEAKQLGRIERAEHAEREIDLLTAELSRAIGLGGRDRSAASAAERARQSVTRTIKTALSKITNCNVALGQLLSRSIKTGTYCRYKPDPNHPLCWDSAPEKLVESGSSDLSGWSGAQPQAIEFPRSPSSLNKTQFVDRQHETELLRGLLERARGGHGSLVMIGGGPGVGKTRLAIEVAEYAARRGFCSFIGHCYEGEELCPYLPFAEIVEAGLARAPSPEAFRQHIGARAAEYAQLAPSLRRIFQDIPELPELPQLPRQQARRLVFQTVTETLKLRADAEPLVVILDDLQWADEPTLSLLNYMANRVAQIPAVIIGTYRDLDVDTNPALSRTLEELLHIGVRPIKLRGLSENSVAQMTRALSSRQLPDHLVKLIFAETQGNPFLVEEIYRQLVEERRVFDSNGELRADFSIADIPVPETVKLMVGRRLERLGNEGRRVLTTAAAIGCSFSFELLQSLESQTDPDALLATIEQAQRIGLLVSSPDGEEANFAFAFGLLRRVLLADISAPRRQLIQFRIADALEQPQPQRSRETCIEMAHHLCPSESLGSGTSWSVPGYGI